MQEARARQSTGAAGFGSAVAGEDATVGGRPAQPKAATPAGPGTAQAGSSASQAGAPPGGGTAQSAQQLPQPPALLAEEVLMYHRASSRLVELCAFPGS